MINSENANKVLPDVFLHDILKTGLVISGGKDVGKSNAGKVITSEMIKNHPDIQVKIFDTASNLRWGYEPILFQEIGEKTRTFYDGDQHILFDIDLIEDAEVMGFMTKVMLTDYMRQRNKKIVSGGYNQKWIVYLIEEGQNIIGTHSLMSKEGKTILRIVSQGRNFGLSFIILGQRLCEISTGAIERCNGYLFGKMVGSNDLAKLKNIVGRKSPIMDEVKSLEAEKGQFIYYNGQSTYDFNCPKYITDTEPRIWVPKAEETPIWKYREGRKII